MFEFAAKIFENITRDSKECSPLEDVDSARSDLGGGASPAAKTWSPSLSGGWLALLRRSSNLVELWNR